MNLTPHWRWRTPPGWPDPPPGWRPPQGWYPPPGWPPPPPGWEFWETEPSALEVLHQTPSRSSLAWETRFMMVAFIFPGVAAAVALIVQHLYSTGGTPNPLSELVPGHPVVSLLLGIPFYLQTAALVPLALLLLARTGQGPSALGLAVPGWRSDVWPAIGLIAATLGTEFVLSVPLAPLLNAHKNLLNPSQVGHVPAYYVVYALAVSATTAVAEEVLVNGYLLVRLDQLGWTPQRALVLSLTLRTSYHVYYGLAFLFTIPFGYFVTRSFQKNGRLTRPIVAHFLYDAALTTIAVLTS